jgi:hypothetical protein
MNTDKEQQEAALELSVEKAQAALTRLDEEYSTLDQEESKLMIMMENVRKEETCLHEALKEATESGAERRARDKKERDDAVVARLESALFESDSSDEDDNDTAKKSGKMAAV